MISKNLTTYLEENPGTARAIFDKALAAARAREAARKAKDMVRRKSALENAALPGKLADCQSRNPDETEIYIVDVYKRQAQCRNQPQHGRKIASGRGAKQVKSQEIKSLA